MRAQVKRNYECLNPPVTVKVALGELVLKFARLTLRRPISLRSSLELGNLFCAIFNEKTTAPRVTHGAIVDINDATVQVNTDADGFMCLSKAIVAEEEPSLKISEDELAQNPHLLERLADAAFKVHRMDWNRCSHLGSKKKSLRRVIKSSVVY